MFSNKSKKISKDKLIGLLHKHEIKNFAINLKMQEVEEALRNEIDEYDDNDKLVYITKRIETNYQATADIVIEDLDSPPKRGIIVRPYVARKFGRADSDSSDSE